MAVSPSPSITPEPSGYQTVNLADYIPDSIDAPDTTYDSVAGVLKIRGNEIVHFELPQTLNTGAAVSVIVEGTWTETSLGWRAYLTASTGVTSNSNVATNNGSAFTGTIGESYSQSFSLATSGTSASKYLAIRGVAGPKPINLDITRIMLSFESPVISSDPQITPSVLPTSTVIASPSASPVVISSPTLMPSSEPGEFLIASNKQSVPMYLDSSGEDYEGLKLVADCFVDDIKLISDADMEIQTDLSQVENNPIIAGSIGNNDVIDRLISEEKLDVEEINGKWETYKIAIVDSPAEGVDKALVIAGSDKRGTIYGIFHVSELMGVSPWVYWADVMPEKKDYISLTDSDLSYTSKEPSVKYRGIFLNDEEPSLGTWATNFFKKSKGGKFNEYFYEHVFQLILRLKGNYMWPAMWSSAFNIEGSESTIASAELANKYGIIMGTSHHEPMMRAHQEWSRNKSKYGTAEWNYETNKEGLQQFFREGVQRNAGYENVITVGMRGDGDAPMLPEGSTVKENISLLKEIITDQKQILKDNNLEDSPTVIALYKEVEDYWYGDQDTSGLKDWDGLEDTIALLAEDNYGYLRTLPTEANKNRSGGWGMYYHFDYNGAPVSYQWIQTLQLQKIWEQMTMAYDYGAKDMWIVNVGDLKPMESAISYFMDMAWDFEQWGTTNIDSPENYTEQWVQEQFGKYTGQQGLEDLSEILSEYLKINGSRRPEKVTASTYSIDNYNEAMDMLSRVEKLIALADKYKKELPEEAQAAYYQLIYYPAVAAANINRMQIYSGLNKSYADKNLANANIYAVLLEESIQFDKELEQTYNKNMPGGIGNKWDGMMAQARNALHVGYPSWEPKGAYPKPTYIEVPESASMAVQLQGDTKVYKNGSADLQAFTNINNEMYTVNVINGGGTPFDYAAQTSHDWIKLTKTSGTVSTQDTIGVQIDFSKISADSTGTVTLIGNRRTVTINITAKVVSVSGLDPMTFVEAHDYISIEAAHYADVKEGTGNAQWKEIKNYGKTLSTLKVFPTTGGFANTEDAPYLEYKVQVNTAGNYTMQTYAVPSNNVDRDNVKKRFGVSVDGGTAAVEDFISSTYIAGTWRDSLWSNGVTNGIHTKTTDLGNLEKGVHTIRIYAMDASLALQKIVLHPTDKALKSSYFGPPESYYVGKEAITSSTVNEQKQMYVASCVIPASEDHEYEVIIPKAGSYEVAVETDSDNDLTADIYWNQNKIGQISATGSDQENILVMDEVLAAEQGKGTLSLSVTNGSSEIKKIYISQIVQEADYEKSVYTIQASSEDGQNIAENVYTHNSRLTWKPLETDTQPYLEFDFGRTVYIDRISITEKEANVNKYKLQFFDGTEWTDAYEGTFIDSGREIFLHGKTEMKGEKMRIVFTDTEAVPVISNVTLMPYINWARED
ncbi:MAG: glycosyl hydrolase 115 family protein, partial [Lachnoclostridium sp.]|nr:glycosyl hydrolase 115 family protein [Lachnoclostridium sp.]